MQRKRLLTALVGGLMGGAGCVMVNSRGEAGWMSEYLKASAGLSASQNASLNRLSWNRSDRRYRADKRKRLRYDNAPTAYFWACTYCARQVSRLLDSLVRSSRRLGATAATCGRTRWQAGLSPGIGHAANCRRDRQPCNSPRLAGAHRCQGILCAAYHRVF